MMMVCEGPGLGPWWRGEGRGEGGGTTRVDCEG